MPSGHAAQVMAFAVALIYLCAPRQRLRATFCLVPAVFAVGFSRLYLQVHWPSDVVAGYFVGGLIAGLGAHLLNKNSGLTQ